MTTRVIIITIDRIAFVENPGDLLYWMGKIKNVWICGYKKNWKLFYMFGRNSLEFFGKKVEKLPRIFFFLSFIIYINYKKLLFIKLFCFWNISKCWNEILVKSTIVRLKNIKKMCAFVMIQNLQNLKGIQIFETCWLSKLYFFFVFLDKFWKLRKLIVYRIAKFSKYWKI